MSDEEKKVDDESTKNTDSNVVNKETTEEVTPEAKPEVSTDEAKENSSVSEETKKDAPATDTNTEDPITKESAEEKEEDVSVEEIPYQDIRSGMTVRVHERIKDTNPKGEERERIQIFEGMILGMKGPGNQRTMTVRKVSKGGFGVEKIYPLASPNIAKVEVVKKARVRRSKLWFLRRRYKKRLKETIFKKK